MEKLDMEYAPRKIALIGDGEEKESLKIRRYQIDSNRHVNNVEYVKMAMEFLPYKDDKCARIKELRAEYKKAAHYGDVLTPVLHRFDDKLQVALNDEQAAPYAIVEFTL